MARFLVLVFLCSCDPPLSRDEVRNSSRRAPQVAKPAPRPATPVTATEIYELGRESVYLEQKKFEAEKHLLELESVTVFIECVEKTSGLPFKEAFDKELGTEVCRIALAAKTPEQIRAEATDIIAAKKQP
jgi:hypothetical protein